MFFKAVAMVLMSVSFTAQAAPSLAPFAAPKDDALSIDANSPAIPCDQIAARLAKYAQMSKQHEGSVIFFLNDVGTKVGGWYPVLQPLEGSSGKIPVGTFAPIQDGADKISQITDMASQNAGLLSGEIDLIVSSLQACTIK